jgi:hypothetical protein
VTFLKNFIKFRKQTPYKEAVVNALRALVADFQPFSPYLGNKPTFYFPIKHS